MAGTEFWRDLKPIPNVFKSHALPRSTCRTRRPTTSATTSRSPRRSARGRCSSSRARTAGATSCAPPGAGLVNRHYHPHQVFAYTISGKWGYLEHDWIATAGDFVYEAPGEAHTLVAHESRRADDGAPSTSPAR